MCNFASILATVASDKGSDSLESSLVTKLLSGLKPDTAKLVTPHMAVRLCTGITEKDALKALHYFASERIALFELVFAIIDEAGQFEEISHAEIRRYLERSEPLVNPATGRVLDAPPQDVLVYFRGTRKLTKVLETKLG